MSDNMQAFAHSQTRENLMRAFAGESQARNRYTIAAGIAYKEGLEVLRGVFLFTADQEKTHAKQFYGQLAQLNGQTIQIDGTYPVDLYDNLLAHLRRPSITSIRSGSTTTSTLPRWPCPRASPWSVSYLRISRG